MPDYGTIKIPRKKYEEHRDRKDDLGLEWAEYIDGQAPDHPDPVDYGEVEARVRRAVKDVFASQH